MTTAATDPTTCQICGRPILAKTGKIAHHGYKRPGNGWQTQSCMGAKHLPYEQSCDLIPEAIKMAETFIVARTAWIADRIANPPAELIYYDGLYRLNANKVARPDGFDPLVKPASYSNGQRYEQAFFDGNWHAQQAIKEAQADVEYLRDRLARWTAPVAATV